MNFQLKTVCRATATYLHFISLRPGSPLVVIKSCLKKMRVRKLTNAAGVALAMNWKPVIDVIGSDMRFMTKGSRGPHSA